MAQWCELPKDLVISIEEKLVLHVNKVRFRAVCKPWRNIPPKMPNLQMKKLPWLLHNVYNNEEATHGLFNPLDKKLLFLNLSIVNGMNFYGSSNGWVVGYHIFSRVYLNTCPTFYLLNPLTGHVIEIPSSNDFFFDLYMMQKIVLSSSPLEEDCMLVAINDEALAYRKFNNGNWTEWITLQISGVKDIIFHKGKLHALLYRCQLFVLDITNVENHKLAAVEPENAALFCFCNLVESSEGELLLVVRELTKLDFTSCKTTSFKVYKHDPINLRWDRIKSIGDQVIFVGKCTSSISVSCRDFLGFKGNRIYFTDAEYFGGQETLDIGVFNLDEESIEPLPYFECCGCLYPQPPVSWLMPSLV